MAEAQAIPNEQLAALLQAFAQAAVKPAEQAQGGWGAPQTQAPAVAMPPILGVAVAIKVPTPGGRARVYLSLPAEVASSYQALVGAIEGLVNAGFPVDLWQDRNSWGQGGGFQGSYRGGFQGRNVYQQNGGWGRRGW